MAKKTKKEILADTVADLVGQLLYYDRKEDEELPRGAIEAMIDKGVVTREEIVELFKVELFKGLPR